MKITIENHGPANGLSWFVSSGGIETGPFTRAEVLGRIAGLMLGEAVEGLDLSPVVPAQPRRETERSDDDHNPA